jgi:glutaredoxin
VKTIVTVYSRTGCHLCENAISLLSGLSEELSFEIEVKLIDDNPDLERLYGEQIPVIQIDGEHHDFWRVDVDRFRTSLEKHRQRQ